MEPKYRVELNKGRLQSCSLRRAFPYEILNAANTVLQYAKTKAAGEAWVVKRLEEEAACAKRRNVQA